MNKFIRLGTYIINVNQITFVKTIIGHAGTNPYCWEAETYRIQLNGGIEITISEPDLFLKLQTHLLEESLFTCLKE